jgi:hypothetical protein
MDGQKIAYATCLIYIYQYQWYDIQVTYTRNGKNNVVPVVLSKNEFSSTEFKGIELENIDAADKRNNIMAWK